MTTEHIQKVVDAYIARKDIPKFAHVASMKEIEENGYNLNIPRYVDTSEDEEAVDISAVKNDIVDIQQEIKNVETALKADFALLGIEFPEV